MFNPISRQEWVNVSYPFIPVIQGECVCFGYYNFKDEYLLCKLSYHGKVYDWEMFPESMGGFNSLEAALKASYEKTLEKIKWASEKDETD